MDVSNLIQDRYAVTDIGGTFEARALRRLYFKQKTEQATKLPVEREKKSYLDLAHTLPDIQPYDLSKARYGLTDRKLKDTYQPTHDARIKSIYASRDNALYTILTKPETNLYKTNLYRLRDEDEEEMYIN